jgi:hypothetical protein
VTNGLVFYLDAANRRSYSGSGTTWIDLSGNGNNGTLSGSPTFSSSNGGSIVFDGVDDNISCSNNASINLIEFGGSVIAWFKTNINASGSINGSLISKMTNTYSNGYWLTKYDDKLRMSLFGTGTLEMIGVKNIADNLWHCAVGVWTPTQLNLYIDGILDKTQSYNFTFTTATTPLYIARHIVSGEGYFNGNISSVSIYNRALTADEVRQNFDACKGRYQI